MKITALIENRKNEADPRLKWEWGLSLHVAHNGHSLLFDSGGTGAFADNAERLSVNLTEVEAMVLSHHHFDHGGGLGRFLAVNKRAPVYLAREPEGACYIRVLKFWKKYVGLDRSVLSRHRARLSVVEQPAEILPDVFIVPQILHKHPGPRGNTRLFLKNAGGVHPDPFAHELVMAIKDAGKLVIFTGCSHSGILNMIDTVAQRFPGVPIKAVIGGFHLVSSPPFHLMAGSRGEVEELGKSILSYPVAMTYTGHCTGPGAFKVLKSVMGDRLADIRTGSVFEV